MSLIKFFSGAFCFLFLVVTSNVFAVDISGSQITNSPLIIDSLELPIDLQQMIEVIDDPNRDYTLNNVSSRRLDHLWRPKETGLIFEKNRGKIWFRIKLRWNGEQQEQAILLLDAQPITILWLDVSIQNEEYFRLHETGHVRPFSSRALSSQQFAFPVSLVPGQTTTIVGSANTEDIYPAELPFKLVSQVSFAEYNQLNYGILVAFYSVMGALILYNACLFLALRGWLYGLYLLFQITVVLVCSAQDGLILRFFWAESIVLIRAVNSSGVISAMAYLGFIAFALYEAKSWKYFKRIIKGALLAGCISVTSILLIDDPWTTFAIAEFYFLLVTLLTLTFIARAVINRVPTSEYLLLSEVCFSLGTLVHMLMLNGTVAFMWGLHSGAMLEAILLSLALAARTRNTQRVALENLLKYEELYEDALEGLFHYNKDSGVFKCNQSFAQLYGFDGKDDLYKHRGYQPVKAITNRFNEILGKADIVEKYEYQIEKVDGSLCWISLSIRRVSDDRSNEARIEGIITDISERKLKEAVELEKTLSEARNQAKTQFFASMSHEFRSPLMAISGYAEIAKDASLPKSQIIEKVGIIEKCSKHLLHLINDILDLSKIEAQKIDIENVKVNPINIVNNIEDQFTMLAEQKGIEFITAFKQPLPVFIETDPIRLTQILINLCSNAVKFTREGSITLLVYYDSDSTQLSFAVQDTGIGINSFQIDELFNAYQQVDNSMQSYGGTGLGLYLSKQFALRLGGDISVQSAYGKGSTFTLSIPLADQNNMLLIPKIDQQYEQNHDDTVPHIRGKLLYAESDNQCQQLMLDIMKLTGAEMTIVDNGLDALKAAMIHEYDLVLIELNTPVMNGAEFAEVLKRDKPNLPIIALTSEKINDNAATVFDDTLIKPISRKQLYTILEKYFEKDFDAVVPDTPIDSRSTDTNDSALHQYFAENIKDILIVDDDTYILEITRSYLNKYPVNIDVTEDGEQALKLYQGKHYDLIIVDMLLPKITGIEIIREIRNREAISNRGISKILCATGSVAGDQIDEIYAAGADGYLAKPFGKEIFFSSLQNIFNIDKENLGNRSFSEIDINALISRYESQEIAFSIVQNFNTKYSDAANVISKTVASKPIDFKALRDYAHGLGSNAGFLFSHRIEAMAREIERMALHENAERIISYIDQENFYFYVDALVEEAKTINLEVMS